MASPKKEAFQLPPELAFPRWWGPDPALSLILQEVNESQRQKVLVAAINNYKAVQQANMAFAEQLAAAMSRG